VIEVPVENKIYVEREYETLIEKPYDVIRENIINKDRIIDVNESQIEELLNQNPNLEVLPVFINYERKNKYVEKPIYIDNIIEK